MNNFNIEEKKKELISVLAELEKETIELQRRIFKARVDLQNVSTYEEAKKFDETHDLEKELEHIRLF